MGLITIRTFDNPLEAHLLRSKLESEGVQSFLFDENITSINPLYNQMIGGVKLKVKDTDIQHVKLLLCEIDDLPYLTPRDEVLKCPACNSTAFYSNFKSIKTWYGFLSMLMAILVTIYPFTNTVYKCKKCGEEFENK